MADQPISTCDRQTCTDCDVESKVNCHFTLKQLAFFFVIAMPSFLLGGAGIYMASGWLLALWVAIIFGYFGLVEIRVMCSHCPHYAEPGKTLTCWANYGAPKLWKYNPGPMSALEKILFFAGFIIVWGLPLVVLFKTSQLFLLLVYALTTASFFWTLQKTYCAGCMNFACPLNRVDEETRKRFREKNPEVAQAWKE